MGVTSLGNFLLRKLLAHASMSRMTKNTRQETDSLGEFQLPDDALYGIYTARVLDNYKVSGQKIPKLFLENYIRAKKTYAIVNKRANKLSPKIADAIVKACEMLLIKSQEEFTEMFPIDIIQSGGGTSTNMMVNEVVANIANELLGSKKGLHSPVHPNDHVNMSQSSNDSFPGVIKLTSVIQLQALVAQLGQTEKLLAQKKKQFETVHKVGRTHLQDALKISVGDEFSAFEATIAKDMQLLEDIENYVLELPFGGTALGSMQNITPKIRKDVISELSKEFHVKFSAPENYFEATSSSSDMNKISFALSVLATDLIKIANDLRLLASGPRAGIGEVILPKVQIGSSIMPGKINPSILEAFNMLCFKVLGNHATIATATANAQLQLQAFMPIIGFSLFENFLLLTNGLCMFNNKCLAGIAVEKSWAKKHVDSSFVYATEYSEKHGYEKIAELVKRAYKENVNLIDLIEQELEK